MCLLVHIYFPSEHVYLHNLSDKQILVCKYDDLPSRPILVLRMDDPKHDVSRTSKL